MLDPHLHLKLQRPKGLFILVVDSRRSDRLRYLALELIEFGQTLRVDDAVARSRAARNGIPATAELQSVNVIVSVPQSCRSTSSGSKPGPNSVPTGSCRLSN